MVDIELGEDLMAQVELTGGKLPDDVKSKEVKFDDRGTPHVIYRNDDGKFLKDIPIKQSPTIEEKVDYNAEVYNEFRSLQEINDSRGKRINIIFNLTLCAAAALCLTFVFVFLLMRYSHVF